MFDRDDAACAEERIDQVFMSRKIKGKKERRTRGKGTRAERPIQSTTTANIYLYKLACTPVDVNSKTIVIPIQSREQLMGKTTNIALAVAGSLGWLSAILGFAAEGTKLTVS